VEADLKRRLVKRHKVTQDKPNPILVAGNLQTDGWAVYEGINISKHEKYMLLENQLRASMKDHLLVFGIAFIATRIQLHQGMYSNFMRF
jgi:hypothetical protein